MSERIVDMKIEKAIEMVKKKKHREILTEYKNTYDDMSITVTEHEDSFEVIVTHPSSENTTGGTEQYFIDKATGKEKMGCHEHPMKLPAGANKPKKEIMSEETKFMRRFQLFGEHGSALQKYGDGNSILKSPLRFSGIHLKKQAHRVHLKYKVGDGILVFEISPSAGVILDISYIIDGNTHWVEEFNPYTGDIIM